MAGFKLELGIEVEDYVTGFRGIVTARCEYLTGCRQYAVQPKSKKKNSVDKGQWFDEDRLVVKGKGPKKPKPKKKRTGGPQRLVSPKM